MGMIQVWGFYTFYMTTVYKEVDERYESITHLTEGLLSTVFFKLICIVMCKIYYYCDGRWKYTVSLSSEYLQLMFTFS